MQRTTFGRTLAASFESNSRRSEPIGADGSLGFASAQDQADGANRWDEEAAKWHGVRTGVLTGSIVFGVGALVGLGFFVARILPFSDLEG